MALLLGAISIGIAFLYGCVGEIITEKSGHLNLGIPGIMSFGAAGGCVAVSVFMAGNPKPDAFGGVVMIVFAILLAALFAATLGGIYSFLTVSLPIPP